MKKVFYAIALLFVLTTLNSCTDYEEKADIENQQSIGHDELGGDTTDGDDDIDMDTIY